MSDLQAEVEALKCKMGMIVSHATGGRTSDITISTNDICVLASQKVNDAWSAGIEKGRAEAQAEVERLREVFRPFVDVRHQRGAWKIITKATDGFAPVNLTVTKAQMLAALQALDQQGGV